MGFLKKNFNWRKRAKFQVSVVPGVTHQNSQKMKAETENSLELGRKEEPEVSVPTYTPWRNMVLKKELGFSTGHRMKGSSALYLHLSTPALVQVIWK